MPTVMRMPNENDERLLALFAQAHETLPSADFMRSFLSRMEQARRRQSMWRVALLVAMIVLAAWIMPPLLSRTAALIQVFGDQSQSYGALIVSPAGWGVSMLIAFLVLFRSGALRRR
jgi:hypothetical protein